MTAFHYPEGNEPKLEPVKVKTDSNGKFQMTLPYGKYRINAAANRDVGDKIEPYLWFVPFTASEPKQTITLSNDNDSMPN